jgi:copper(I)-binding protein
MRMLLAVLLTTAVLYIGCGASSSGPRASVENARVTLPAVKGRPGAAYFTITAAGAPARLTGVTSPRIQRIELHESMAAGMGPLRDPSLPAGVEVRFEPSGTHAMLFGVDPTVKVGERVPMTFALEGAPAVTVNAEVQGPGGAH